MILLTSNYSYAQTPGAGLLPPLDIPLELSGNFMELRSDHFHSGLDFKTQGVEGKAVKAAGDGWVSRIKISPWGYGKAVYIDHPNGYTTVYGHLKELKGPVGQACLEAQYRARDYSIDITPEKGAIPVKAGEVIALSGNTGGSTAPHLHFEVRRTGDQHALDPEAHGIELPDSTPPLLLGLRVDPLDSAARIAPYPGSARGLALVRSDSVYVLKEGLSAKALGNVGLSLNVIDRYDNSGNSCGIRSIELWVDGMPTYSCRLDEVDFGLQRYCNAYIDFALFKLNDLNYNRCYRLPNNKLEVYGSEPAMGRILVVPGQQRQVRFKVTDANGNASVLRFTLQGPPLGEAQGWPRTQHVGEAVRHDREHVLARPGMRFTLPPNALYQDIMATYGSKPRMARSVAPVHVVHTPAEPLHVACELALEVPAGTTRTDKLVLARIAPNGAVSTHGGHYANGWVTGKVKAFGSYTVMGDTVPPKITPLDLKADMRGRASFSLKVQDDLTGMEQWSGTLDGSWILLEYEPKTKTLRHTFDGHSEGKGSRDLKVEATDERGNKATYTFRFER
ncbi:MAG: M23 family metallopeptidase [Flavobacteriales bacterium]|nr:M23 family metallopeptidase [Flavobacteriales bacterium]